MAHNHQMNPLKHLPRNSITRRITFLAILASLIAVPFGSEARPKPSGLTGQVFLHNGLVSYLGRRPAPNQPFPASLRLYSAATNEFITTVTTDSVGRFEVELPAGCYRVVPDTMFHGRALGPGEIVLGRYEQASPIEVKVRAHHLAKLVITYEECMGN